jgi:CHAT domain-containing protein
MNPQANEKDSGLFDQPIDSPKTYAERIACSISPRLFRLISKQLLAVHDVYSYKKEIEKFIYDFECDESGPSRVADEIPHIFEKLLIISDLGEPEISLELLTRFETSCDRMLEENAGREESIVSNLHFLKSSFLAFRANISDQAGSPVAAEKYYKEAIEYRVKSFDGEVYFARLIMSNQACMYLCHGMLEDAERTYQSIPPEYTEECGKNSLRTVLRMRMLAQRYHFRGRDDLAVKVLQTTCMIAKESPYVGDDMVFSLQSAYGNALLNVGRFADAQECFENSLEHYALLNDKRSSNAIYQTLCNNLALALWRQGMPERADSVLSSLKPDTDHRCGTKINGQWSNIDSTRGLLGLELGQADELDRIAQLNAASAMKLIGDYWHWPDIACAYHNYACYLYANGQPDRALSMFCVALSFSTISSEQVGSLETLNNIACIIGGLGGLRDCKNILHFALDMRNIYLEPEHPDITLSLANLAYWYFQSGDLAQSIVFSVLALARDMIYIFQKYSLLPQSMRLEALRSFAGIQHQIYEIASLDVSALHTAYWTRINRHGILQSLEKTQMQLIRALPGFESHTKELSSIYRELRQPCLAPDRRIHLLERQDRLEKSLYKSSPLPSLEPVSLETLFNAIPPHAILLEFVCIPKKKSNEYRVFTLNRDLGILSFDYISDAKDLDELVAKAHFTLSNGLDESEILLSQISQILFAPLASRLEGPSRIYITFDGSLHQLPLLALPHWQNPEKLLSDYYCLTILTSSRDLLAKDTSSNVISRPVVVAATDFKDSLMKDPPPKRGSERTVPIEFDPTDGPYEDIPYAGQEGKTIASILSAELVSDSRDFLDFIRSLRSPRILHLVAHGIYSGDQIARFIGNESTEIQIEGTSWEQGVMESLRSTGIILGTGSDHNSCAFLSALEIAKLDLTGTELVVLSACETGLVNVATGEGVYGLERALIVAGANAMLLSLWAVPDAATCTFMIRFYTLLKAGLHRLDALLKVQKEFREHQNQLWRDPYYWGAWQLIGDGGPISNL